VSRKGKINLPEQQLRILWLRGKNEPEKEKSRDYETILS